MISINMNVDKFLINDLYKFHSEYYEKFLQIEVTKCKYRPFEDAFILWAWKDLLNATPSVPMDLFIARLEEHLIYSCLLRQERELRTKTNFVTSQKVINYTAFPSTRFSLFPHWFPFEKDFIQQFFKPTFVVLTPWFWWRIF